MIKHVRIQNFRSFVDAEVGLRPFTLLLGANGSGKSNFLKFFQKLSGRIVSTGGSERALDGDWDRHTSKLGEPRAFQVRFSDGPSAHSTRDEAGRLGIQGPLSQVGVDLPIFNLDPSKISGVEAVVPKAIVASDGSGTAQVLESLKNGDREDLFDKIEANFKRYVPEVEKLSLHTVKEGKKQIQVRERGLPKPLPADELSEGTRLILGILTILHQEKPPAIILLEDIDRGMHPRLFEFVVPLMRDIAEKNGVNIVATSHNPYLVDHFQEHSDAVVLVEKKDGASSLATLASRLAELDYEKENPDDMPLGTVWYTGLVGGVPSRYPRRSGEPRS